VEIEERRRQAESSGNYTADSHNPQKARILLMLALLINKDQNIIQEMFPKF